MHTLANDSDGTVEQTVAQPPAIVGTSPPSHRSSWWGPWSSIRL